MFESPIFWSAMSSVALIAVSYGLISGRVNTLENSHVDIRKDLTTLSAEVHNNALDSAIRHQALSNDLRAYFSEELLKHENRLTKDLDRRDQQSEKTLSNLIKLFTERNTNGN